MNYFITLNVYSDMPLDNFDIDMTKPITVTNRDGTKAIVTLYGIDGLTQWDNDDNHKKEVENIKKSLQLHKRKLCF